MAQILSPFGASLSVTIWCAGRGLDEVFYAAVQAAGRMTRWKITHQEDAEGRIEGFYTTFLMRTKVRFAGVAEKVPCMNVWTGIIVMDVAVGLKLGSHLLPAVP